MLFIESPSTRVVLGAAVKSKSKSVVGPLSAQEKPLSTQEKIGYGIGDAASNFYWKTIESFLVYFYTDVFGIRASSVGFMMLITRVLDAINDPIIGYVADRTVTTWGRFRPYLLWFCVPLGISAVLVFYTPDLSVRGRLAYAYVTYALFMLTYTMVNIPYSALMGVITADSLERTSVSVYRFVFAFLGGLVVQYLTLYLVEYFGAVSSPAIDATAAGAIDEKRGFFWTAVVFACAATVLFILTFAATNERVEPLNQSAITFGADMLYLKTSVKVHQLMILFVLLIIAVAVVRDLTGVVLIATAYCSLSLISLASSAYFRSGRTDPSNEISTLELDIDNLLVNKPWLAMFGYGLFSLSGSILRGGAVLYYFKYYVQQTSLVPMFLVSGAIAGLIGMIFTRKLVASFEKRQLLVSLNLLQAAFVAAFFFIPADGVVLMFVFRILSALVSGPICPIQWSMYADIVDYSEIKNGRRATGLIFSSVSFSQKLGCAIGASLVGASLSFFEYVEPITGVDQPQTELTLLGVRLMISVFPSLFILCAAFCLGGYIIDSRLSNQAQLEPVKTNDSKIDV